ncbi:uncharacterized protein LOC106661618 isoform X2 [Cimex lectularius]|uniref:Uncharacterized protein n=1 Tax=Cimex lectularius TaxID=79782 RepID=A0A8I6RA52_CIMLE|nr:uncharacterized protein LOC106661618 isoform X2 [Cimex lectularius]
MFAPGTGCGDHADPRDRVNYLDEKNRDFRFSWISNHEFNAIYKQVKRERQRKKEAKAWEKFIAKKQAKQQNNVRHIRMYDPYRPHPKTAIGTQTETHCRPKNYNKCKFTPPKMKARAIIPNNKPQLEDKNTVETVDKQSPPKKNESCVKEECLTQKEKDEKMSASIDMKMLSKKLEDLRRKIVLTIRGVDQALSEDPMDLSREEVDILRSKKRNSAFTSRFKGNYLYQMACQINDIKKIISNETVLKSKPIVLVQKFVSAHQIILQAMQALEKHLIAYCSSEESFSWLTGFLQSVCEVSDLLPNFDETIPKRTDDHNDVKMVCKHLIEKIEKLNVKRVAVTKKKQTLKKIKSGNTPQDSLWMYRANHMSWKEKVSDMTKRKNRKSLNCSASSEKNAEHIPKMPNEIPELRKKEMLDKEEMGIFPEESEVEDEEAKESTVIIQMEAVKPKIEPKMITEKPLDSNKIVKIQPQQPKKEVLIVESECPANVKVLYINCEDDQHLKKSKKQQQNRE